MTPPTPKSGAEAVPTVKIYTSYGGMMLDGHRCEHEPEEFVSLDAFDRQSAELAQAREAVNKWEAHNEALLLLMENEVVPFMTDDGLQRLMLVLRMVIDKQSKRPLIALRAERGQAEVGGTEAKDVRELGPRSAFCPVCDGIGCVIGAGNQQHNCPKCGGPLSR